MGFSRITFSTQTHEMSLKQAIPTKGEYVEQNHRFVLGKGYSDIPCDLKISKIYT